MCKRANPSVLWDDGVLAQMTFIDQPEPTLHGSVVTGPNQSTIWRRMVYI